MKKVFFWDSNKQRMDALVEELPSDFDYVVYADAQELLEALFEVQHSNDSVLAVVMDMDQNQEQVEKVQRWALENLPDLRRILISQKMTPADLKKHQRSELAADAYLKHPIDSSVLYDLLNDFNTDTPEEGAEKEVEAKVEESADDELSLADLNEAASDENMDENLGEGTGDIDTPPPTIDTGSGKNPLECTVNKKIQEQFDEVFDDDNFKTGSIELNAKDADEEMPTPARDITDDSGAESDLEFSLSSDVPAKEELKKAEDVDMEDNSSTDLEFSITQDSSDPKDEIESEKGEKSGVTLESDSFGDFQLESAGRQHDGSDVKNNDVHEEEASCDIEFGGTSDKGKGDLDFSATDIESNDLIEKNSKNERLEVASAPVSDPVEENPDLDFSASTSLRVDDLDTPQEATKVITSSFDIPSAEEEEEAVQDDDLLSPAEASSLEEPAKAIVVGDKDVSNKSDNGDLSLLKEENKKFVAYHEEELLKLSTIIKNLREEREKLIKKQADLENENVLLKNDRMGHSAEVEELKVELALIKKRYQNEMDNGQYKVKLLEDRELRLVEQNKKYKEELEQLGQKIQRDFKKIQEREKELECQLELLKGDSQAQINGRDRKILELKRQVDGLEFDVQNMTTANRKIREEKAVLNERLIKVMHTLKMSMNLLEVENDDLLLENEPFNEKLKL